MVTKILFDLRYPEIIFSQAALRLNLEPNEWVVFIPTEISQLALENSDELAILDPDYHHPLYDQEGDEEEDNFYLTPLSSDFKNWEDNLNDDYLSDNQNSKEGREDIILLNIHPCSPKEKKMVLDFFEHYETRIKYWIDVHDWDKGLVHYLNRKGAKLFAGSQLSCLQVLNALNYVFPYEWLSAEYALSRIDLRNPLAARYFKALLVTQSAGWNRRQEESYRLRFFQSALVELATGEEDFRITTMEAMFFDMASQMQWAKNNTLDNHPLFLKAKEMKRSVGYLNLDEIDDYTNIKDILHYGSKKFPWLFLLEYTLENRSYLRARSRRLPVKEIMSSYRHMNLNQDDKLRILSGEITSCRYKNRIKRRQKAQGLE